MKQSRKTAQGGFTLMELIVVIVILGILAATALPKLNNLSADAQRAKLKTAFSALNAEVELIHGKVLANSTAYSAATGTVTLEGVAVPLTSGTSYPAPSAALATAAGLTSADYQVIPDLLGVSPVVMLIAPNGVADIGRCNILYTEGSAPAGGMGAIKPTVEMTDTDCK